MKNKGYGATLTMAWKKPNNKNQLQGKDCDRIDQEAKGNRQHDATTTILQCNK